MHVVKTAKVGDREITIEVGKVAKQAHGSAWIRCGETIVLAACTGGKEVLFGRDFLPLTVDYIEKTSAAGRIPGGFFKREGRPTEKEVLSSRIIDRSIRPLFPKGYRFDTQVVATVLSADPDNNPDSLACTATSAALTLSDICFEGPVAAVRIARSGGRFIANPTYKETEESDVDLFVTVSRDAIVMVEGGARMVPEDVLVEALFTAHEAAQPLITIQEELRAELGKPKKVFVKPAVDAALEQKVRASIGGRIVECLAQPGKVGRNTALKTLEDELVAKLVEENPESEERAGEAKKVFEAVLRETVRGMVLNKGVRIDGRRLTDVRPIACEVGLLPRTHGSALFTRGETQAVVVTTLGTSEDEQRVEMLTGEHTKRFMLHYNFPPYSVGEVKMLRSPSRREIGHGALSERALSKVMPDAEKFPYTIRVLSEILESNGSSSMASVCGGSLSLMDAGVPIVGPVAGVAMGLMKEGDKVAVLTDIMGDEDHLGDMDFKVAGTKDGICAVQMDIKVKGLDKSTLLQALEQAREARLHIIGKMAETIAESRGEISPYAPRITTIMIRPEKIKDVIGPGGKVIREIIAKTGVAAIDIEDDGSVKIAAVDGAQADAAIKMVREITKEAEVGKVYQGTVVKVTDFGAFVEIFPGTDGLVHISELSDKRVARVTDVCREGDEIVVKVLGIDRQGKIRLSRKEALGKKPD
ncbi:MAG: polyribonucleotide nucleotidyltransferase [Deltaproteobacteria bacterium]|nr:polyribonucleotide nucleotidyltransferase [Deltaproteobacteria bacterium]